MYRLDHTDVVSLFCSATLRAVVAYGVCWATRSVWHALRALACLCSQAHVLRMLSLLGAVRGERGLVVAILAIIKTQYGASAEWCLPY